MSNPSVPVTPVGQVPTAAPAAPSAPDVLDAPGLVMSLIAEMPTLSPIKAQLEMLAALISWKRLNYSKKEALEYLLVTGVKLPMMQSALTQMKKILGENAEAIAADFEKLTDTALNPDTLDIKTRTQAELEEQSGYRKAAFELQARVTRDNINLFAEAQKSGNSVQNWFAKAAAKVSGKGHATNPSEGTPELPGWKTLPLLNDADPDVAKLLGQLGFIEAIYAKVIDPKATLKQLANVKYSEETIRRILEIARDLAQEQIVQSDTITKLAQDDQATFTTRITANHAVGAVIKEAEDFLNL
jgi:predicted S18 family serine protease